ncbi:MAG TPA: hypothetical protein VFU49_07660 [Ktedonobacteraceae bacterium]|nr:hypothetical protein [Ktedonobacteraceae bacterium]
MKKVCSGCGQERDAEKDFSWKYQAKKIRQKWCKLCLAEANRKHYQNNKQIYLDRTNHRSSRINAENKQRLYAYLAQHPCVDCGCADVRCLEFDHVRGKKSAGIARMLHDAIAWPSIEAEIAKCEVRCANCHRIKTSEQGGFWRNFFDL